ncbi:hypothetical protein AAW14_36250 [Streptomyces hygroscopicus]|nr:hypothetical protein [Streptomyces hygroscopicus]
MTGLVVRSASTMGFDRVIGVFTAAVALGVGHLPISTTMGAAVGMVVHSRVIVVRRTRVRIARTATITTGVTARRFVAGGGACAVFVGAPARKVVSGVAARQVVARMAARELVTGVPARQAIASGVDRRYVVSADVDRGDVLGAGM